MNIFDAIIEIQQSLARLNAEVERLKWAKDNSAVHGFVTDVDAEKQLCRVAIGKDGDDKDVKSPWLPYSQTAGTRKVHSPPSKGQQMTVMAPNGDLSQSVAMPFTWSKKNPSPSKKADEDIDQRGKTKRTQRDADLKQEVDGVTHHLTKKKKSLTIHKSEQNAKKVDDENPWEGNKGDPLHNITVDEDGGYSLTINVDDDEHKIKVHPTDGIEHSFAKGKHKIKIDKKGIKHSVDDGQHEVEIGSSGLGDMLGGQLGNLLGGANLGALQNQLLSLLGNGQLEGILNGANGGLAGLLNGQLGGLLGNNLVGQLASQLLPMLADGSIGGALQGGIKHKSTARVQIEAPQIEHQGDMKVIGSVLATKVIQSQGFLGNLQGVASGIGFSGGLTPPTNW